MTENFTEKGLGNMKHRPKARERQTEARAYRRVYRYQRECHRWGCYCSLLSQEDQTRTHRSTRQISRDVTSVVYRSFTTVLIRSVFFSFTRTRVCYYCFSYISQGSV